MDNKNLRGLSEAYNDVYSDNLEQLSEAAIITNNRTTQRAIDATNDRAQKGVVKTKQGYAFDPTSKAFTMGDASSYKQRQQDALALAQKLNRQSGLNKATPTPRPAAPSPQPVQSTRTQRPSTGLSTPASSPRPAPTSSSRPTAAPSPRPTAATSRPTAATVRPTDSAKASIPERIKGGMQIYNAQRASGDMKGAASTGMGVWKNANPILAAKPKTSYNPLMNKTFGYQTGNSPKDISKANAIVSSGQVAALKPATPAPATPIAAAVKPATPTTQKRNQTPSRAPITQMNASYDFGKPDQITQDVASLYQSIYEAKKKVDQDQDGDNDFADVRIARMVASGMSLKDAIAAVRNKSYNEETELDEGRSENIRDKMVARYGKPSSGDTLRLHVARKKYDKATSKHQSGYGPNPRTEIKGKLNPGQLMYKAGQSANVNKEDFEFWVNDLLDEGYDLSDYTVDEMYEIFEESEKKLRPASERTKTAKTRAQITAERAKERAAEKKADALERAAQKVINQTQGRSGRVSENPMGSEAPAAKEAAPNRDDVTTQIEPGEAGSKKHQRAHRALKAAQSNEDFNLWVNELLDEGYDLSDYTWDELGELYEGAAGDVAARAAKLARQRKGQTPERKEMYKALASKAAARERYGSGSPRLSRFEKSQAHGRGITPADSQRGSEVGTLSGISYQRSSERLPKSKEKYRRQVVTGVRAASSQEKKRLGIKEDIYDNAYNLVIGHLLDEGFADDYDSANMMIERMSDEWLNEILESKN